MTVATRAITAEKIRDDIVAHINKSQYSASSWYVGITQDVEQRVFGAHNVPRNGAWWIIREAYSSADARKVEEALICWGCDGGNGGGDNDAVYVYAYLKTTNTRR